MCNRFTKWLLNEAVFTCVIDSQSLTKVCESVAMQGNQGNVKSFSKSVLLETLPLLTSANQEVREMDPEIGRVMVSSLFDRDLNTFNIDLGHLGEEPLLHKN